MEIIGDRIGIILKYGKVMGRPTKRFFFVDNEGNLHYTEEETIIKDLIESPNKNNRNLVDIVKPHCKQIKLNDCSLSSIKPYLEKDFDLQNRSHFEVFNKSRDFRSLLIFSYKQEYITSLYEFICSFKESFGDVSEEKSSSSKRDSIDDDIKTHNEKIFSKNEDSVYLRHFSTNNIFRRDEKYMDDVLVKLEGKFVNQINWNKDFIKIINPSSKSECYVEELAHLDNDSTYSGQVKDGMPHGLGKEYRQDGSLYGGSFYQGKWHGFGTLTNENLDSYSGEYIDGCICGI